MHTWLQNDESSEILAAVFWCKLSYFEASQRFLIDNSRKLNFYHFQDKIQNLNIILKTTATESLKWLNERYNEIISY